MSGGIIWNLERNLKISAKTLFFLLFLPASFPSSQASILWLCNKGHRQVIHGRHEGPSRATYKSFLWFFSSQRPKSQFSLTVCCSVSIPSGDQFDLDEVEQSSSNSASSNNLRDSTNSCEMVHVSQRLRQGHQHHHAALMHQLNNTGYNREATTTRQSFE